MQGQAQLPVTLSLCQVRTSGKLWSRASLHLLWEQELTPREGLGDGHTVLGPSLLVEHRLI